MFSSSDMSWLAFWLAHQSFGQVSLARGHAFHAKQVVLLHAFSLSVDIRSDLARLRD